MNRTARFLAIAALAFAAAYQPALADDCELSVLLYTEVTKDGDFIGEVGGAITGAVAITANGVAERTGRDSYEIVVLDATTESALRAFVVAEDTLGEDGRINRLATGQTYAATGRFEGQFGEVLLDTVIRPEFGVQRGSLTFYLCKPTTSGR